jgi:hypothetical protein
MVTSSRKESRPRLRIRRSQERGTVKGARETWKRRRAWQFALAALSHSKLGGGPWGPFACTKTSMLGITMLDFWCEVASSIGFYPRLDLSSLPHSGYPEQRSYGARHFHQVQRVWVTSFILPLTTPARRRTKQGGLWYHTFGYPTSPTRCSGWNLLRAVLFRLAAAPTTSATACNSTFFCLNPYPTLIDGHRHS